MRSVDNVQASGCKTHNEDDTKNLSSGTDNLLTALGCGQSEVYYAR